jgi:hypothetical protein
MINKVVRISILVMLAVFFLFGPLSINLSYAAKSNTASQSYTFDVFILDWVWNGNLDTTSWPPAPPTVARTWPIGTTIGEVRADMTAELGYPVVLFTATDGTCASNFPLYHLPNDSDIVDNYYCGTGFAFAVFKSPKPAEVVRLTLFGYVSSDNKSCVLWSLDGSLPNNVNKTCGMEVERVCKIKLVEKKLKYDCEGGYDWLGEQIIHDPQWLSWADKFASMNGRK